MSSIYIFTGRLTEGSDLFVIDCEVAIDEFISADQAQMPPTLAEGVNRAIAFADAVCRDFGVSTIMVGVSPGDNQSADLEYATGSPAVLSVLNIDGYNALSVADSMTVAAYLAVTGFDLSALGDSVPSVAIKPFDKIPGTDLVTVTVNNDDTGEIVDRTQAQLVVKLDSSRERWELKLLGSYDIASDKFVAVNGEDQLGCEALKEQG